MAGDIASTPLRHATASMPTPPLDPMGQAEWQRDLAAIVAGGDVIEPDEAEESAYLAAAHNPRPSERWTADGRDLTGTPTHTPEGIPLEVTS